MSKRKPFGELLLWLTAKSDRRESKYIQVGESLLQNAKYQALSDQAKNLYLCMCLECGKRTKFPFSETTAAEKYGIKKAKFWRLIDELSDAGFIVKHKNYFMKPNEYELKGVWKDWKMK